MVCGFESHLSHQMKTIWLQPKYFGKTFFAMMKGTSNFPYLVTQNNGAYFSVTPLWELNEEQMEFIRNERPFMIGHMYGTPGSMYPAPLEVIFFNEELKLAS